MARKATPPNTGVRIVNRKAKHDYHILEKIEVGIVLWGCEVKSIRNSQVSLAEGFANIEPATMELFLHNVDIAPYSHADPAKAPDRKRRRKLLAHKREIAKLHQHTATKGTTLVPLAMYFVRGMAKLEIGIARGKRDYDKRQSIKNRDSDREIRRGLARKVIK